MAGKKSIGFVITSLGYGGAEKVVIHLANYFSSIGYRVSVLTLGNYVPLASLLSPDIELRQFSKRRIASGCLACSLFLKTIQLDVLIVNLYPVTGLLFFFNFLLGVKSRYIPVEHNCPTMGVDLWSKFKVKIQSILVRLAYNTSGVVCVSKSLGEHIRKLYVLPDDKVFVVYNPVHLRDKLGCYPKPLSRAHFKSIDGRRFLSIGSLTEQKNHHLALRAVRVLKSLNIRVYLTIVGEGPLRNKLTEEIVELDISDLVSLEEARLDLSSFYNAADVFLLTSNYEGFGMVIVEALSFGLPVISTDCNFGPREILGNGTYGVLLPCGDVGTLVKAMSMEVYPGTEWGRRFRAMYFSVEQSARGYEKLFS